MTTEFRQRFASGVFAAGISIALFYATSILLILAITALWIGKGRPADIPENQIGYLPAALIMTLPLLVSWLGIKFLKKKVSFHVAYPENASGGMALGLGSVLWFTAALFSGAEYYKPSGWKAASFLLSCLTPATLAMAIGGSCAAAFLQKDRSVVMLLASPVVAIASFLIMAIAASLGGR